MIRIGSKYIHIHVATPNAAIYIKMDILCAFIFLSIFFKHESFFFITKK